MDLATIKPAIQAWAAAVTGVEPDCVVWQDEPTPRHNGVIVFLGLPAVFNDGPFRLAALLRRKVFFMAGLYVGGVRYDVLFEPLADFSERIADPVERERRIRAALESYVARLEALCRAYPHNWFNFHDFWLEDSV